MSRSYSHQYAPVGAGSAKGEQAKGVIGGDRGLAGSPGAPVGRPRTGRSLSQSKRRKSRFGSVLRKIFGSSGGGTGADGTGSDATNEDDDGRRIRAASAAAAIDSTTGASGAAMGSSGGARLKKAPRYGQLGRAASSQQPQNHPTEFITTAGSASTAVEAEPAFQRAASMPTPTLSSQTPLGSHSPFGNNPATTTSVAPIIEEPQSPPRTEPQSPTRPRRPRSATVPSIIIGSPSVVETGEGQERDVDPDYIGFAVTSGSNPKRRSRSAEAPGYDARSHHMSPIQWQRNSGSGFGESDGGARRRRRSDEIRYWRDSIAPLPPAVVDIGHLDDLDDTIIVRPRHIEPGEDMRQPVSSVFEDDDDDDDNDDDNDDNDEEENEEDEVDEVDDGDGDGRRTQNADVPESESLGPELEKTESRDTYNFGELATSMHAQEGGISIEERVLTLEVKLMDLEYAISKLQAASTSAASADTPTQAPLGYSTRKQSPALAVAKKSSTGDSARSTPSLQQRQSSVRGTGAREVLTPSPHPSSTSGQFRPGGHADTAQQATDAATRPTSSATTVRVTSGNSLKAENPSEVLVDTFSLPAPVMPSQAQQRGESAIQPRASTNSSSRNSKRISLTSFTIEHFTTLVSLTRRERAARQTLEAQLADMQRQLTAMQAAQKTMSMSGKEQTFGSASASVSPPVSFATAGGGGGTERASGSAPSTGSGGGGGGGSGRGSASITRPTPPSPPYHSSPTSPVTTTAAAMAHNSPTLPSLQQHPPAPPPPQSSSAFSQQQRRSPSPRQQPSPLPSQSPQQFWHAPHSPKPQTHPHSPPRLYRMASTNDGSPADEAFLEVYENPPPAPAPPVMAGGSPRFPAEGTRPPSQQRAVFEGGVVPRGRLEGEAF